MARATASKLMSERGMKVTLASSVSEAVSVDAESLRAALLDLEVGEELGTDLATSLRSRAPSLPIAFLTAAMNRDLLAEARRFGPVFDKTLGLEQALAWLAAFWG